MKVYSESILKITMVTSYSTRQLIADIGWYYIYMRFIRELHFHTDQIFLSFDYKLDSKSKPYRIKNVCHVFQDLFFISEYFFNILSALEIEPLVDLKQIKQLLEMDIEG